MKSSEIKKLQKKANKIRKEILNMIFSANASHVGSSYSIVELLVYLYNQFLMINPKKPFQENRDKFILSKGWGVSALYAMLADKRFLSKEILKTYCQDGSRLIGSSTRNGIAGIEATTGSMGHGLPIGIGMALASKIQSRKNNVVVLISDGELDEGSTWESILFAGHHKLTNLIVIVDYNKLQSFGKVKDILGLEPLREKFEAFNWNVLEIDGHDFNEINRAFLALSSKVSKPSVIIAHTIKGKGVSIFENKNEWHYKTPNREEMALAIKELSS